MNRTEGAKRVLVGVEHVREAVLAAIGGKGVLPRVRENEALAAEDVQYAGHGEFLARALLP
jgi:hypothetical protein